MARPDTTLRPQTLDFVDRAPVRATRTADVPGAPAEVFAVLADPDAWPRFFPGMRAARWLSPPPHGVGSRREVTVGPSTIGEEFIAWDEGALLAFTFVEASGPPALRGGVERVALQPAGVGTRVAYTFAVEPVVPLGPVAGLLARGVGPVLDRVLAGLARELGAPTD